MAQDEVWSTGEANDDPGDPTFGEPDYENGLDANDAFSVDAVFRYGVAALQEQPQVAVLGGVNLFVLSLVVGGIAFGVNLSITAMGVSGQLDQQVADVLTQLSGMVMQLIAWPFNQLVMAGLMVAGALWVQRGEASVGALYTSVRAAIRALLASIVVGLAGMAVAGISLAPAIVAGAVLAQSGDITTAILAGSVLVLPALPILIYVNLGLLLAPYAAVLDHLGPVESVQQSWAAASGARVTLFVTSFVFGILGVISACMCSVPLIVLIPIQVIGFSSAYLRYARHTDETAGWEFFSRNP